MGGGEQSNAATYFVVLKNWDERKGKKHTAAAIVDRFNMEAYIYLLGIYYIVMLVRGVYNGNLEEGLDNADERTGPFPETSRKQ